MLYVMELSNARGMEILTTTEHTDLEAWWDVRCAWTEESEKDKAVETLAATGTATVLGDDGEIAGLGTTTAKARDAFVTAMLASIPEGRREW